MTKPLAAGLRAMEPRMLAGCFVALSAAVSVAVLGLRNLYDDELLTLYLATGHLRTIFEVAAEGDVHPPGMYLIARLGWALTHSYRWLNLVPMAILYLGLAVFVVRMAPLVRSPRGRLCFLLLATLHPQLLLWSNTFRWYCPWTGLALIALTLGLQPGRGAVVSISVPRAVCLSCITGLMFYLNYITLLFALSLGAAMLVRYRGAGRKPLLRSLASAAGIFVVIVAPQVPTMLAVHLPNGHAQRYGVAASLVRLTQSLGESEAFLPWHPLALLAFATIAGLSVSGTLASTRRSKAGRGHDGVQTRLEPMVVFALLFFAFVGFSGLGGKPRSGLLLVPLLAPIAAAGMETLHRKFQTGMLLLLMIWSATGLVHLLDRYGLSKAGMTDRPEEVVRFVQQNLRGREETPADKSGCAVIVTYDSALAFQLAKANLPEHRIISPYGGAIFGGSAEDLPASCLRPRLFVVESYIAGSPADVNTYTSELHAAARFFEAPPGVERFDPDPGAGRKQVLANIVRIDSGGRLPEFRYVVFYGSLERARYGALVRALPHFYSLQNDRAEGAAESDK